MPGMSEDTAANHTQARPGPSAPVEPAAPPAPALYATRIRHVRTEPVRRSYEHASYWWFVDLDDLPVLPGPFAALARFRGEDHLDGAPGDGLRTRVDDLLARHGVHLNGGRITALMNARVLGYVFNPLTVYWCHDPGNRLVCVIAEVHNTYGERHSYVLHTDGRGHARADKRFYVSPFNDTSGAYRMTLPEPGEDLHLAVTLHREGHDPFIAVVTGERMPATGANIARAQARAPWAPLAVSAYIRAEGLRLWAKGLPIQPRPAHRDHASTDARVETNGEASEMRARHEHGGTESRALPATPRTLRARIAAPLVGALFRRAARDLAAQGTPIRIEFPDGTVIGDESDPRCGSAPAPRMILRDPESFARRVGADGLIGFGEAYMAGDWTSPDLSGVLTTLASRMAELVPRPLQGLRRLYVRPRPAGERNTTRAARHNVAHHYDRSNALFGSFLDETMTYSAALFPGGPEGPGDLAATADALAAAQRNKIDRLLDRAGVGEGTRLLEIGTGWGELCVRAAARGALVRSVTLSEEQRREARRSVDASGYADSVRIDLCDYRELADGAAGAYDAIVSVEMVEAVGHEYWRNYFAALDRLLAQGGTVAIQAITMPHDRMLRTRDTYTWIQKYVFPGGFLPSTEAIEHNVREYTSLHVAERFCFGAHYARTLRMWDERCEANGRRLDALGFDRDFRRMWHFYLCYSEAGFRSGYLDVQQIVLTRPRGQP